MLKYIFAVYTAEAVSFLFQLVAELKTQLVYLLVGSTGQPVELFQQSLVFVFKLIYFGLQQTLPLLVLYQFCLKLRDARIESV